MTQKNSSFIGLSDIESIGEQVKHIFEENPERVENCQNRLGTGNSNGFPETS